MHGAAAPKRLLVRVYRCLYYTLDLHRCAAGHDRAAIPMLLATGRAHHHLVSEEKRTRTALIIETAEAREVRSET